LAEELRLAPARAPRTAAWLKEWELVAGRSRTGSRTTSRASSRTCYRAGTGEL
jgi:hypothetical protein